MSVCIILIKYNLKFVLRIKMQANSEAQVIALRQDACPAS